MIELKRDTLVVTFPDIHPEAELRIEFQRTLRIPDDDREYPLPPGLGRFPLRHVDDFAGRLPARWKTHGGVMLPMYQAEAVWLSFSSSSGYPFAVKVAAGKVNAVTGDAWENGLHRRPQDYLSIPEQPWLDGFCVGKGVIRQFVAMPLGAGYSAEEQITGTAEHGGLQLSVHPLKRDVWERLGKKRERMRMDMTSGPMSMVCEAAPDMGLAPGGRMRQEIYDDPFKLRDWETAHGSRCFVHLANSMLWRSITGQEPPTAEEYTRAGLPWFEFYAEGRGVVEGAEALKRIKSVAALGKAKGEVPLPENTPVEPDNVVALGASRWGDQVRDGGF